MKHYCLPAIAAALLISSPLPSFAGEHSGFVDFGKFSPSTSGREFVEVHLKTNLISMAARLAEKDAPDVAELLRGLHLIRVNVIGLDDSNRAEVEKRIVTIRSDLDKRGWERVVSAQEKNQDVSVFIKTHGDQALEGVVVMVLSGKVRSGWDKRAEVSVGPVTMRLAQAGLGFLPPDVREAASALRGAKAGVYQLHDTCTARARAALLTGVDASMGRRGWERVVGVLGGHDMVAIYAPSDLASFEDARFALFVLSDRDLVVAWACADLEPLLQLARRHVRL